MEYWISHVDQKDNHIDKVKAFMYTVEGLKNPNHYKRDDIVKSIEEENNDWYTCVFKEELSGRRIWEKGAEIHTVEIDGEKYIRTDKNNKKSDNLGKLPSLVKNYNEKSNHKEIKKNKKLDI